MSNPKFVRVVQLLLKKTLEDEDIIWEETSSEGMFSASFSDWSVLIGIRPSRSTPDSEDVFIQLVNYQGNVIDEIDDEDMRVYIDDAYNRMSDLYQAARRRALGVDEALNDILRNLEE